MHSVTENIIEWLKRLNTILLILKNRGRSEYKGECAGPPQGLTPLIFVDLPRLFDGLTPLILWTFPAYFEDFPRVNKNCVTTPT